MNPTITEADAARAWARAYNSYSAEPLEPLIAEDICYASQWVFEELRGRDAYLHYLRGKLATLAEADLKIRAELAETRPYPGAPNPPRPCVVITQEGDDTGATVLFEVKDGAITRIDMCAIPDPSTCALSGEIPD